MRLLLVRLDGIGDALACTPLLAALRAGGHEVGLALSDRNAAVFAPGAALAVHVLERIPWPRHGATPASRARADAQIAALRYDAALIASEEPDAYDLASPVPRRVGFTTGWAKPLKTLWARRRLTVALVRPATSRRQRLHEVEELFRLGAGFTAAAAPSRDPFALRPLIAEGPAPVRSGIVVQLGMKWLATGVPAAALATAVAALRERGARFLAAPSERTAVAGLVPGTQLEAPSGTRSWIAAVDGAAALVSVDTGAAHLAGMLGVPVVDVFPDAGFDDETRRWLPWAAPSVVLRAGEVARAPGTLIGQALDAL